jgi:hypothetical protein
MKGMKLSTYKSLLIKRTMLVASKGRCGHKNYTEYQIMLVKGQWLVYKTDGYKLDYLSSYDGERGLKSVINLVWGK